MGFSSRIGRPKIAAVALALAVALAPAVADARAGSGSSFGSRGGRTFSAPPATSTAPRTAAPIERSFTPNAGPAMNAARPAGGGFFSGGGFGRGLLGGFIGAGLFGMLFGHGLMGGFGGGMSIIGLLLQIGLIVLVGRWLFNRFANRPSFAGFGGGMARTAAPPYPAGGGFGSGGLPGAAPAGEPLTVQPADFDAFERLLGQVQTAFAAEDQTTLRGLTTAEMGSYFAEQIAENVRRGVQNKISDVRLVKGDLSEGWRERGSDYATVAMRFSLVDVTVDRTTGRVVTGDANRPDEVTEVWTFARPAGTTASDWRLSAIQQA